MNSLLCIFYYLGLVSSRSSEVKCNPFSQIPMLIYIVLIISSTVIGKKKQKKTIESSGNGLSLSITKLD